jgi:hypothetical protein
VITAFSSIVGSVMQLLADEPPVSGSIYRARAQVIPKTDVTAVTVQWDGAMPERRAIRGAPIDWSTRLTIDCYARSTVAVTGIDEAVDVLLLAVYNRIAAHPTLAGHALDVGEPVLEAEYGADGEKTGWVRMTYIVKHRTKNSTLEKA